MWLIRTIFHKRVYVAHMCATHADTFTRVPRTNAHVRVSTHRHYFCLHATLEPLFFFFFFFFFLKGFWGGGGGGVF